MHHRFVTSGYNYVCHSPLWWTLLKKKSVARPVIPNGKPERLFSLEVPRVDLRVLSRLDSGRI